MSEEIDRIKFLKYFETFSSFKGSEYDGILVHLRKYAIKYGLDEDDMSLVTTISFQQNLGFMRIRKLLMCLVPRRYCSDIAVQTILRQLIKYKDGPTLIIKQFLQWLIGVIEFSLVKTNADINTYYHLFVYFMKFEIIDVPATKLVYFLTTPDDVSKHYTKRIFQLYRAANNARHFAVLLYLFKCYRPDIVPEKIPIYSARNSFGKMSNGILESLLCAKSRIQKCHNIPLSVDNVAWNKFSLENITNKTSKGITLIPDTYINFKDVFSSSNEISCVLSLLNNPVGMYMIMFGPKITQERLSYQLYFVLYDAFLDRNANVSYAERNKILEKVAWLQNSLRQPIPVVSKFIGQFLMRWDGYEHQKHILNICEWMHAKSFTELRQCVLTYLLDIFKCNPVQVKCRILNCLGNFIVNVIMTYVQREIHGIPAKLFNVKEQYSFGEFIKQLFLFLENISLLGLALERNHAALLNTIVIIHENILVAGKSAAINFKLSKIIPYTALFHPTPNALNVICKLMNEFPACTSQSVKQDFIDCLLNNKAFTPNTNKGSIFNEFNRNKYAISNIEKKLHLKHHYAFSSYTFLINDKTTKEEHEKILIKMKRKYLDIFKFLKQHN